MRSLILAAATALLAGCWTGENLYSPSDARPALPPGLYRSLGETENETGRITILPNGMSELAEQDGSRPDVFGFAPLDESGSRYVVWGSEEEEGATVDDFGVYGLLERSEGPEFRFYYPQCSETEAIARAAGAAIERNDNVLICRFPDRAGLERAMRQWRPDPAEASTRLVRVGD